MMIVLRLDLEKGAVDGDVARLAVWQKHKGEMECPVNIERSLVSRDIRRRRDGFLCSMANERW